jgi:hypothetical protein
MLTTTNVKANVLSGAWRQADALHGPGASAGRRAHCRASRRSSCSASRYRHEPYRHHSLSAGWRKPCKLARQGEALPRNAAEGPTTDLDDAAPPEEARTLSRDEGPRPADEVCVTEMEEVICDLFANAPTDLIVGERLPYARREHARILADVRGDSHQLVQPCVPTDERAGHGGTRNIHNDANIQAGLRHVWRRPLERGRIQPLPRAELHQPWPEAYGTRHRDEGHFGRSRLSIN